MAAGGPCCTFDLTLTVSLSFRNRVECLFNSSYLGSEIHEFLVEDGPLSSGNWQLWQLDECLSSVLCAILATISVLNPFRKSTGTMADTSATFLRIFSSIY